MYTDVAVNIRHLFQSDEGGTSVLTYRALLAEVFYHQLYHTGPNML